MGPSNIEKKVIVTETTRRTKNNPGILNLLFIDNKRPSFCNSCQYAIPLSTLVRPAISAPELNALLNPMPFAKHRSEPFIFF
jgi:hypothetical protein